MKIAKEDVDALMRDFGITLRDRAERLLRFHGGDVQAVARALVLGDASRTTVEEALAAMEQELAKTAAELEAAERMTGPASIGGAGAAAAAAGAGGGKA